jgi:hypothetical protein
MTYNYINHVIAEKKIFKFSQSEHNKWSEQQQQKHRADDNWKVSICAGWAITMTDEYKMLLVDTPGDTEFICTVEVSVSLDQWWHIKRQTEPHATFKYWQLSWMHVVYFHWSVMLRNLRLWHWVISLIDMSISTPEITEVQIYYIATRKLLQR